MLDELTNAGRRMAAQWRTPLSNPIAEWVAVLLTVPLLLSVAVWNGFPLIFYDTGAYILQGFDHVFIAERSPVYSLFLRYAGGPASLWYVAVIQSVVVAFVIVEFARALKPGLPLWVLLAIGAVLSVATGLPWYAGQIEPDSFTAVAPIAIYLLAFHRLGWVRNLLLTLCAAFAASTHTSHLGVAVGLSAIVVIVRVATKLRPAVVLPAISCALAFIIIIGCNYAFSRHVFINRTGSVFLTARMMQDGLIKPVLDAECPSAGYKLCAYKNHLPDRADTFLWVEQKSPFARVGGFKKWSPESSRLLKESLSHYPLSNLAWVGIDTALQFFAYPTGDGIVPQEWVLETEFRHAIPKQTGEYNSAYQQRGELWFLPVNLVHVPVALFSVVMLFVFLRGAASVRDWRSAVLPAFIVVALLGNAFICGVFSGPHFRYQSRMMWWPTLAVILIGAERIPVLRQRFESVT